MLELVDIHQAVPECWDFDIVNLVRVSPVDCILVTWPVMCFQIFPGTSAMRPLTCCQSGPRQHRAELSEFWVGPNEERLVLRIPRAVWGTRVNDAIVWPIGHCLRPPSPM